MERGPRNPSSSSRSTATSSRPATARINLGDARAPDWKASGGRRMRTITQKQKQKQKQSLTIKEQGRGHEQDEEEEGEDEEQPNVLIGTCPFMCPEGERSQRERLRDLSVFERLHGNPGKTSPGLAIKKFCRTISSKSVQASDVRPPPILEETLTYLLSFLDSIDHDFEVIHDFIFDRTRSIRQDLVMQNITNHKAIVMYEKMVKFHVISHLKLRHCSNTPSILSVHYLNMEQLIKTLTSLYGLYDANRDSTSFYKNEAEFRSLYVLLHLNPTSRVTRELLSLWLCHVPLSVIKSKEMCFARSILRFLWIGNFKRFFCTIATEATYLQYCIIEPFINEVRAMYLSCINNVGYKLHPYPVTCLSKLMRMKESDVVFLCNACGLHTCTDEGGNKLLPTKQTTFCSPKAGFQNYKFLGLEEFES